MLRTWRFVTLLLGALGLALGTAHVLELPPKKSTPAAVPEVYLQLRTRWEFGHVAAFAAWLVGFSLLVLSVLMETPTEQSRI
ncbi:MAG: hypothetical protein A2X84_13685 [Desulfuromonadaceae bacterium GWC2_58_13]|nr:MAG: hypothetical protein A2X84_13685 [Desulfuromonadaceae bacterium GWC2_58_13]